MNERSAHALNREKSVSVSSKKSLEDLLDPDGKGSKGNTPVIGLDCVRLLIVYEIKYEGYELDTNYGLIQFERFYPLYKQFNEAIKHSKEVAETMQEIGRAHV